MKKQIAPLSSAIDSAAEVPPIPELETQFGHERPDLLCCTTTLTMW
jgi:hypothetical protein